MPSSSDYAMVPALSLSGFCASMGTLPAPLLPWMAPLCDEVTPASPKSIHPKPSEASLAYIGSSPKTAKLSNQPEASHENIGSSTYPHVHSRQNDTRKSTLT